LYYVKTDVLKMKWSKVTLEVSGEKQYRAGWDNSRPINGITPRRFGTTIRQERQKRMNSLHLYCANCPEATPEIKRMNRQPFRGRQPQDTYIVMKYFTRFKALYSSLLPHCGASAADSP
jgi:hypothetical protein